MHVKYFSACYEDAMAYLKRLRVIEPPVYYKNRLAEKPVPSLERSQLDTIGLIHLKLPPMRLHYNTSNSIEIATIGESDDGVIDAIGEENASADPRVTSVNEAGHSLN